MPTGSEIGSPSRTRGSGGPSSRYPMRFERGEMRKLTAVNGLQRVGARTNRPAVRAGRAAARGPSVGSVSPAAFRCGRRRRDRLQSARDRRRKGTALEPAHAADQVCGPAAEHRRRLHASGHGQVGARALETAAEAEALPCLNARTTRPSASVDRRTRPRSRRPQTASVVSASTISSGPISVISSVAASGVVADQLVGKPMRERVHRAGDGHAGCLACRSVPGPAPSSAVRA